MTTIQEAKSGQRGDTGDPLALQREQAPSRGRRYRITNSAILDRMIVTR